MFAQVNTGSGFFMHRGAGFEEQGLRSRVLEQGLGTGFEEQGYRSRFIGAGFEEQGSEAGFEEQLLEDSACVSTNRYTRSVRMS